MEGRMADGTDAEFKLNCPYFMGIILSKKSQIFTSKAVIYYESPPLKPKSEFKK